MIVIKNELIKTQHFLLVNERFYCTNGFTQISFSEKTNEIDGKLTITLSTNEITNFKRLKKNLTKLVVHER